MSSDPEAIPSAPDRAMQERAVSAGGNAAMLAVVEACGGIGIIQSNETAGRIAFQNIAAFRAELGRPLSEIESPDFVTEVPNFTGLDEQDSTRVIPKLQTAFLLYTTAMRQGWGPKPLQDYANVAFGHLSPEELQDAGVDIALTLYTTQWDNETPGFERQANQVSSS